MRKIANLTGKLERLCHPLGGWGDDYNGAAEVKLQSGKLAAVLFSNGEGWEHVSVSLPHQRRCPTWEEMCEVKALFFFREECVLQYHPAASQYVNCHPYTLHLWRPTDQAIPTPPMWML